jgi:small subunit ribosomal protein S20
MKTLLEEVVELPNIKSAKKRVEVTKTKTARNKIAKSSFKTNLKRFDTGVVEGNREEANSAYKDAVKTIDKAAGKGIIHKNTAARKKSRLALKLNQKAE